MSGHIGDMDDLATQRAFGAAVEHLSMLTGVAPRAVAADRHPAYRSRRWALDHFPRPTCVEVQHHHAHVASTMAEHGVPDGRRVIGVAFDGTGYGDDGASWGGEFLVADYRGYDRAAHLAYVDLPGGDAGVRNPCRMALSHLRSAGVPWDPRCRASARARNRAQAARPAARDRSAVRPDLEHGTALRRRLLHRGDLPPRRYDAQAAMELEAVARPFGFAEFERRTRTYYFGEDGDPTPVIWSVVQDVRKNTDPGLVAARFQAAVVDLVVETVDACASRPVYPR